MPNEPEQYVTGTGKVLTDTEIEKLADEAERGYDVSDQPPTEPEIWLAELVSEGRVVARVTLTTREEAEQALAGKWRVVRYVRADQETAFKRLLLHAAAALERADVDDAEEAAAILRGAVTPDGHYIDGHAP